MGIGNGEWGMGNGELYRRDVAPPRLRANESDCAADSGRNTPPDRTKNFANRIAPRGCGAGHIPDRKNYSRKSDCAPRMRGPVLIAYGLAHR